MNRRRWFLNFLNLNFLILNFLILSLLLAFTTCFVSCSRSPKVQTISFTAMNTYMTVKSYGKNSREAAAANQLVQQEVERLEKILSTTIELSDIWKINNSNDLEISVKPDTAFLLEKGLEFYKKTDGAFNPALYPVIREWGFTTGDYKIPSEEKLLELLRKTDFSKFKISSDYIVSRPAGFQLDFGAIGKGYAGDKTIEILRNSGISSALLDFGGNIQVLGSKPDGSAWTVGIKNPWGTVDDENEADLRPVVSIKLRDACMITSGGYERFFTRTDGHRYIHIFDSKTGRPVENDIASVTIICKEGLHGDALSTSLFAMGLDKAVDFWRTWRSAGDFDFVILTKDRRIIYSAPLKDSISLLFDFDFVQVADTEPVL